MQIVGAISTIGTISPRFLGQTSAIPEWRSELIASDPRSLRSAQTKGINRSSDAMTNSIFEGRMNILPSEIERRLEVSVGRNEIEESLSGRNLTSMGPSIEIINQAKSDLKSAIDEIANAEHVQLTEEDKEKLANISILLLKKVSAVV